MPTVHRKLAVVAGLALAAGALGSGVAIAGSSNQAPATRPTVTTVPAAVVGSSSSRPARSTTAVKAAAPRSATAPRAASSGSEDPSAPDTDNVQSGDQTSPDAAASVAGETGGEQENESATESDGAGGHQDPAGNVDHQFDGEE